MHLLISAYCFFRISNRHTFGAIFGIDLLDSGSREHYRELVGDMIVSYLTSAPEAAASDKGQAG